MTQCERFEEWAKSQNYPLSESKILGVGVTYQYATTEAAWRAWQAACPEGWQAVPSDGTTEEMDDAVRGFLLMLSMRSEISYERLREELAMRGETDLIGALPEYAQFGEAHIPKAAQADILFRLMCSAAPRPEDI
ncbi:MAG: hypothetical protein ACQEW0_16230 [Pseudomonadota bacterium]